MTAQKCKEGKEESDLSAALSRIEAMSAVIFKLKIELSSARATFKSLGEDCTQAVNKANRALSSNV